MTHRLIAVAVVAVLGGCTSSDGRPAMTDTDALLITCESYSAALNSLAPLKAGMKPSEVKRVDNIVAIVSPICRDGDYKNAGQALAAIQPVVIELVKLKTEKADG